MVAAIISPPGLTISAQRRTNRPRSATCSTTSMASTTSKRSPASASASAVVDAVIDREAGLCGVQPRRLDIGAQPGRRPRPGAKPRQGLAQDAAAAADVEDAQAREAVEPLAVAPELPAGRLLDVAEPHRVELVQHAHLAARVPPGRGQRREARDLVGVDGRPAGRGVTCVAFDRSSPSRLQPTSPRRYVYAPFRAGASPSSRPGAHFPPETEAPPWPAS